MDDKIFVDGLFYKAPREGAPDFVKGSISIKPKELIAWLQGQNEEWVNIDIKEGKSGKLYCEKNNWKPSGDKPQSAAPMNNGAPQGGDFGDLEDLPF